MKIGLFFGSFNPVHVGHMIIANHIVNHTDLDQVWMVVSPHNPLKTKASLAKDHDRLHLVNLAIGNNLKIKSSDIEFNLPKPSYTVDTLAYLHEKFPDKTFSMIMGSDNLINIEKWKNFEYLLNNYTFYIYNRPNNDTNEYFAYPNVILVDAPLLDISATYIRQAIKHNKSIEYLVPDRVFEYLKDSNMYK